MEPSITDEFLKLINDNLGITFKISRAYFDDLETREDVRQEMMYQLWRSYPSFDHRSRFSTWMYRVCLNTAFTYHKRSRKAANERLSLDHDHIAEPAGDAQDEELRLLHEGIATLSSIDKAIVVLYMDDLSYEEIAVITGLTRTNVSVRLHRLKKTLETYIRERINR